MLHTDSTVGAMSIEKRSSLVSALTAEHGKRVADHFVQSAERNPNQSVLKAVQEAISNCGVIPEVSPQSLEDTHFSSTLRCVYPNR